jgi:UDPglucose 6-dehydrogenase
LDLTGRVALTDSALGAVEEASALVVATQWPEYRHIAAAEVSTRMVRRLVLDANRFTGETLGAGSGIEYLSVGRACA